MLTLIEPLPEALWLMLVEESNAPSPGPAEEAIAALTPTSTTDDRLAAGRTTVGADFSAQVDAARWCRIPGRAGAFE